MSNGGYNIQCTNYNRQCTEDKVRPTPAPYKVHARVQSTKYIRKSTKYKVQCKDVNQQSTECEVQSTDTVVQSTDYRVQCQCTMYNVRIFLGVQNTDSNDQ